MNVLDKFSFKEVFDACLYEIDPTTEKAASPVLVLDTLKVATFETACQQVNAVGGQGQSTLLTWDYGKDITLNFTDALFSMKSLATLHKGRLVQYNWDGLTENAIPVIESDGFNTRQAVKFQAPQIPLTFLSPNGKRYFIPLDRIYYNKEGRIVTEAELIPKETYLICFSVSPRQLQGININGDDFPGVYYFTGETVARNMDTNEDEFCQFVIPKLKLYADFNLELSGRDPSVFSFRGRALSTSEHQMMSLVKYGAEELIGEPLGDINDLDLYDDLDRRLFARFAGIIYD